MIRILLQTTPSYEPTTGWILIGFGALMTIYLLFIRPKMRKRDPLEDSGPRLSLAQQRNVENQMQNLLVELSLMAREMNAQLDTRTKKLELLIQEADRKIALMEAQPPRVETQMRLHPPEPIPATHSPEPPVLQEREPLPPVHEPDPRHSAVYSLANEGLSSVEIAQRLGRPRGEIELILALRGRG